MKKYVNKVILVGNLCKDPEVHYASSGRKIVNLTIATSETWNDHQPDARSECSEWHRVVIFNDLLADVAELFLRKGRKVYLDGELRTRKWTDQEGQERYSTEVVLDRFKGDLVLLDNNWGNSSEGTCDFSAGRPDSSSGGGDCNGSQGALSENEIDHVVSCAR
ncbi:MAG: single-stranded DNA-binding protein [Acetobacter sp.]|jgi:single-strand DNA-binding protein|nr:single-stranded DNA-binding protein [Acetobacter sp.]MCI1485811.1 single-stranded DNA-binding protein [Acetobacter sp.]MCI1529807.1 single-stranded DNA-binding protein [Acetobacter sp.]MCI1587524.1 single-stranded DNA-binding protein [Acetobacter sp.]MCI1601741.1 single-stranded DNA-binding protein [Acetobacter sp.]